MARTRTAFAIAVTTIVVAGAMARSAATSQNEQGNSEGNSARARNVILFLGDGMGDSEITIARNYQVGANGRLWMDALPSTG